MTPFESMQEYFKKTTLPGDNLLKISAAVGLHSELFQTQSAIQEILKSQTSLFSFFENNSLKNLSASLAGNSVISKLSESIQQNFRNIPFDSFNVMNKILGSQMELYQALDRINLGKNINIHNNLYEFLSQTNTGLGHLGIHKEHLFTAMQGLTGNFISTSIKRSEWNLLNTIDDVNQDIATIANHLSDTAGWGEDIQSRINRLAQKINELYAKVPILARRLMNTLMIIIGIHTYISFCVQKPAVTLEDLKTVQVEIQHHVDSIFAERVEYRVIDSNCILYKTPSAKSPKLTRLHKSVKVRILLVQHKWVLIGYENDTDNFLRTGWIMKKYTDSIKPNKSKKNVVQDKFFSKKK